MEFKGFKKVKNARVLCGWINTPEHPGYPPSRKPTGATVAEVARFNTRHRDFPIPFLEKLKAGELKKALARDLRLALKDGVFLGTATKEAMMIALIASIKEIKWKANTPEWSNFKAKHNLSSDPLIASQVMLNSIRAVTL